MIIVDTAIWATHFDREDEMLTGLLAINDVLMHPFVVGEILLGNVRGREAVRIRLNRLPRVLPVTHAAVMTMIESERLFGSGIGYVDAHLAAAARLRQSTLWTRDKKLLRVAERLGVAAELG